MNQSVEVRFLCVADEESESMGIRGTEVLVERGYGGDFAITGEPTNLHVGVQAKGVLALRLTVSGSAAHGSTPWLGDNAVLKANDIFRQIEAMPFARESSDMFDRPSINLGKHRRRRRDQQGARHLHHGRRHPVRPRPGPGSDPRRHQGDRRHTSKSCSNASPPSSPTKTNTSKALHQSLADASVEDASSWSRRQFRGHRVPRRSASRRSNSAPSEPAITVRTNTSRSARSPTTAAHWSVRAESRRPAGRSTAKDQRKRQFARSLTSTRVDRTDRGKYVFLT